MELGSLNSDTGGKPDRFHEFAFWQRKNELTDPDTIIPNYPVGLREYGGPALVYASASELRTPAP
jgi:hypothetical protein